MTAKCPFVRKFAQNHLAGKADDRCTIRKNPTIRDPDRLFDPIPAGPDQLLALR